MDGGVAVVVAAGAVEEAAVEEPWGVGGEGAVEGAEEGGAQRGGAVVGAEGGEVVAEEDVVGGEAWVWGCGEGGSVGSGRGRRRVERVE